MFSAEAIQTNIMTCSFNFTTKVWCQEHLSVYSGHQNGIPTALVEETLTHQVVRVKDREREG